MKRSDDIFEERKDNYSFKKTMFRAFIAGSVFLVIHLTLLWFGIKLPTHTTGVMSLLCSIIVAKLFDKLESD